jgi:hypothetical protein
MEVAKLIIEFAKAGERDPERLCDLALQQRSILRRNLRRTRVLPEWSPHIPQMYSP